MWPLLPSWAVNLIPNAIHAYWLLACGAAVLALLPVPGTMAFRSAVRLTACRGKLWEDRPQAKWLGPLADASVPQDWFLHFYVAGAIWNAALLSLLCCSSSREALQPLQATRILALLLLEGHLVRRALETRYLMRYPFTAKMHLVAYAFGLSYYFVLPLALLPHTLLRQLSVGSLSPSVTAINDGIVDSLSNVLQQRSLRSPLAVLIFLFGNWLQFSAHQTFARMAVKGGRSKSGYHIPKGGAFELVSCPHYLGEILLYLGLAALIGDQSLDVWLILAWVVLNLVLAAGPTHAWYRAHFKTYPGRRRALIPFVY